LGKKNIQRLMISATQKSSGKTIVSLGILHSLLEQGKSVQSFKKGPDYIDPMWLKLASGDECHNLDPYLMGAQGCLDSFSRHGIKSGMALIEGNHGLHDGMSLDGSDSSAGLANLLKSPVLLVINSRGMNRGAAALVTGIQKNET
jgi:cobyrinic acid a,c-diamide synthase